MDRVQELLNSDNPICGSCFTSTCWCVWISYSRRAKLCLRLSPRIVDVASSKRPRHDENRHFRFVDQSTPVPKRPRLKAQPIVLTEVCNVQQERTKQHQAAADLKDCADSKSRVEQVLGSITDAGYKSLYEIPLCSSWFVLNRLPLCQAPYTLTWCDSGYLCKGIVMNFQCLVEVKLW